MHINDYSKITALYSRMIGNFLFRLLYLLGKIHSLLSLEKSCFSSIPDMRAISAILFHSCLAVLSALIPSSLRLYLPIFFVSRYGPMSRFSTS